MKPSAKKSNENNTRGTLIQVARLYYEENLSQQMIADRLTVSRSLIAQYLQRARDAGMVRIQIVDPNDACADLAASLKKATGVRQVTVITNPRGSHELAFRAVASAAANFLSESLKEGDTLGLGWGRTTSLVVDSLKPPHARSVDVLPLMGESGHSGMYSQMNQLAVRAAEHLQATAHFLSLPMVVSSPSLRDALVKEAGIQDVIERWNKVNRACVGIGAVPPVPGMVVYIGEEYLPCLVEAGAVGDMCGVYYDLEGRIIESGLENRMIAAQADQLKAIDGLVAAACGADKAEAVLGALRTGMISSLFIDRDMAEQILARISAAKRAMA